MSIVLIVVGNFVGPVPKDIVKNKIMEEARRCRPGTCILVGTLGLSWRAAS